MMYVSIAGLEAHMGGERFSSLPDPAGALESCEARLLALILPNVPVNDEQIAAFSRAVYAQVEHELAQEPLPEGVKAFSLGSFSATLDGKSRPACETARAILMNAGLLYRGVQC